MVKQNTSQPDAAKPFVSADWVFEGDPRDGDLYRAVGLVKDRLLFENFGIATLTPRLGFDGFDIWLNEAPVEVLLEQRESDFLLRFRSPRAPKRGGESDPLPATSCVPMVWEAVGTPGLSTMFKFGGGGRYDVDAPSLDWKCDGPDMIFRSASLFTVAGSPGSFRVALEQHDGEFIVRVSQ